MNLSFAAEINGKPSYFKEKILLSLGAPGPPGLKPKLHTIRRTRAAATGNPEAKEWQVGDLINFCISAGLGKEIPYNLEAGCSGIQEICICRKEDCLPEISIDGRLLNDLDIMELVVNDGFDCLADFLNYFRGSFSGVLIHWTKKRY